MNWITYIIMILLIFSIFSNLIMYNKYVIYKDSPYLDPKINENIDMTSVKIYYSTKIPNTKCYKNEYESIENEHVKDIKVILNDYQDKNKLSCYIKYGNNLTQHDYTMINELL